MIIYPDIEIKNGQAVNLTRGLENDPTIYDISPLEAAKKFEADGAEWLHVVDIDGVFQGGRHNAGMISEIIDTVNMPVQVGGGIRTISDVEWWLDHGAERVVLGTVAVKDQHLVWDVCGRYPGKVVISVDSKDGYAMIDGWRTQTSFQALELAKLFEDSGAAAIIYTDINRFEDDPESSLAATTEMGIELNIPVISTGTVRELDDVSNLKLLPNIHGVIIGKAFFSHAIDVKEAIAVARGPGVHASLAEEGVAPKSDEVVDIPVKNIDCVSIAASDAGGSAAFYEALGFVREDDASTIMRHRSGVGVNLQEGGGGHPQQIVLSVGSLSQTRSSLEGHRIDVMDGSVGNSVSIQDPDGNLIVFQES